MGSTEEGPREQGVVRTGDRFTGGCTSTLVNQFGEMEHGTILATCRKVACGPSAEPTEDDLWVGVFHGFAHDYQLYHWDGGDWELQDLPLQKSDINQKVVVHAFSTDSVIAYGVGGLTGGSRVWHFDGNHLDPIWSARRGRLEQQGTMLALARI